MRRLSLIVITCILIADIQAQRVVNICGEAQYVVPEYQSLQEAKRTAIERAKIDALADEFGTIVSQTNTTALHNTNGKTESNFNSYSENEVRGIWLNDTREPEISVLYKQGEMVIHVSVCGKAREIKSSRVDLDILTLCNGFESENFHDNDRFSIAFKSPVKGYVAIFIRDDNNEIVNVMMPYDTEDANGYAREIKANKDYRFLSTQDPSYPYQEETILITDRKIETNTLLIVFSEKPFRLSLNNKGEFVPIVELAKFQKWLHGLRIFDTTVQVEERVLTIKK